MRKEDDPYIECATCKVLDDCPCPDVPEGPLSMPMPPANCNRPIEVMKQTLAKHKLNKDKN